MEFTPINTQEEFDTRVAELYGDVNDLQGKITAHTQTIEQLQGQIKGYETAALKQRIAQVSSSTSFGSFSGSGLPRRRASLPKWPPVFPVKRRRTSGRMPTPWPP